MLVDVECGLKIMGIHGGWKASCSTMGDDDEDDDDDEGDHDDDMKNSEP